MCTYQSWLSTEVYWHQKLILLTNIILIFLFFTLPFNIGNEFGVKAVFFTKPPSLAIEKEFLLNKLHTNKSGDFTEVHPRNHLFKSEQNNKNHGNLKKLNWMQGWQYGKGLIYLRSILWLTRLAFLRGRATLKEKSWVIRWSGKVILFSVSS